MISIMMVDPLEGPPVSSMTPIDAENGAASDDITLSFIGENVKVHYTNLQYETYPDFAFPEN